MHKMFSPEALKHFERFCAASRNPPGAFDSKKLARDEDLDTLLANETILKIKSALEGEGIDKRIITAVVRTLCGVSPTEELAGDEYTQPQDDISDRLMDLMNYLKSTMQPTAYSKAEIAISELMKMSKARIDDHHAALNEASSQAGDNGSGPPDFAGKPKPPAMDSRSWSRPSNASGTARKRMLANMARIGQAF